MPLRAHVRRMSDRRSQRNASTWKRVFRELPIFGFSHPWRSVYGTEVVRRVALGKHMSGSMYQCTTQEQESLNYLLYHLVFYVRCWKGLPPKKRLYTLRETDTSPEFTLPIGLLIARLSRMLPNINGAMYMHICTRCPCN